MRTFTFSTVSFMFVGLAACNGGSAEDCSDNADNDGDAAVDCDDSECATDAACDDTNDTKDTTVEEEICDDADGDDEDDDGDANCADSDCTGTAACDEILAPIETADATITATSWSGTGTQGWAVFPLTAEGFDSPDRVMCEIAFDSTGVEHDSAADCDGCDFAFNVTFSNTGAPTGEDCTNFEPPFGANVDGNEYGYGYHAAYVYGTDAPVPALMYFGSTSSEWGATGATVSMTGDNFKYALPVGYLYYY